MLHQLPINWPVMVKIPKCDIGECFAQIFQLNSAVQPGAKLKADHALDQQHSSLHKGSTNLLSAVMIMTYPQIF